MASSTSVEAAEDTLSIRFAAPLALLVILPVAPFIAAVFGSNLTFISFGEVSVLAIAKVDVHVIPSNESL